MRPDPSVVAIAALIAATPAAARERVIPVDLPAGPADEAIRVLGRQARVTIGFRESGLARLPTKSVRGTMTPSAALLRLFAGSPARARRVATDSFVIERAPLAVARATVRPIPAVAKTDAMPAEDVVVTATKRAVSLQDYAGAAQIFRGDKLSLGEAATGTGVIEARAASVSSTHLGPGRNKLFIRGIADSSLVGPTQATVGLYWGNSRVTYSAPDPSLRLYDIESVEVLEGPQGTLYGAGSLGGVVRVNPKAPDLRVPALQVWGGLQAVQDGDPGGDGGVALNVPIAEDRLAVRAVAYGGLDGGYIDDRLRGRHDVNQVRTVGGRIGVRYLPGGDWTIDAGTLIQRIVGDDSQYADLDGNGLSRSSTIAQPFSNRYLLGELAARKSWGDIQWTTSAGYVRQRVAEVFEGPMLLDSGQPDVPPDADVVRTAYLQDNRIRMLTAETRLSRSKPDGSGWVVGLAGIRNVAAVRRGMNDIGGTASLTGVRNEVTETTLFGEYAFLPARDVVLSVGGRATRSALQGKSQDVARAIALRIDPGALNRRVETRFLPAAALVWRIDGGTSFFTRYQEGFRPGGIAVRREYVQRFEGDRVGTAEAGLRVSRPLFDSNLTVSYTRWRDIQADIVDGFGFPTTANIGAGRIWSVGWSGLLRPAGGLELDASLYRNASRLTQPEFSILPIDIGPIRQDRLPNVANYSGRIGLSYNARLSDHLSLDVAGYGRYVGKSVLGVGSVLSRLQGEYLDTGVDLRLGDDRRGFSIRVGNLFNARGNRFSLGTPFLIRNENQITPLQPRSVRIGFDMKL